jgi:hypothetical protein
LNAIPDYVEAVVLAFALVRPGHLICPGFMYNPPNSESGIHDGVQGLKKRGKKVLVSVGGWGGNCWANVTDAAALADSIMQLVTIWELDGVDIDYEADNYLDDWMKVPDCPSAPNNDPTAMLCNLVNALRARLGAKRLLTAVTGLLDHDHDYITPSMSQFNWVSTMGYGSTETYDEMAGTYVENNKDTKFVPFSLGVSCNGPQMPLEQVEEFCGHKAPRGKLAMMFWNLSEDNPGFTCPPTPMWTYASTINTNLPR